MKQKLFSAIVYLILLNSLNAHSQNGDSSKTCVRPVQLTFVYPLGTNGVESGKITNNFSFNIFAGHNGGLNGAEIGGFSNTIKHTMTGFQIAGFSNVVLGEVSGCQISGFSNFVKQNVKGCQIAGFSNVTGDSSKVSQFSGFSNVINGSNNGIQISGFSNVTSDDYEGAQICGFSNVSRGTHRGCQIAGFSNVSTGNLEGLQLSGFINVAGKLKGAQIGFINVCDTVENGIPFGFISIVTKGYKAIDLHYDESHFFNIGIHTGADQFYNIFTAGLRIKSENFFWSYGYGVGSKFRMTDRLNTNLELTSTYISPDKWYHKSFNMICRLQLLGSYRLINHVHLFGGVSANAFITNRKTDEGILTDSGLVSWSFYRTDTGNFLHKFYPGFSAGIRIF